MQWATMGCLMTEKELTDNALYKEGQARQEYAYQEAMRWIGIPLFNCNQRTPATTLSLNTHTLDKGQTNQNVSMPTRNALDQTRSTTSIN